jgi:tetratricopeptide (TPR) repeat protein
VLELAGESSAALERFREAVRADPAREAGHAGVARLCEKTGRIDEAIEAFEGWANAARGQDDPAGSAARLLRAAEIELAHGRVQAAESHLRSAVEAAPEKARAWVLLAELLADADRVDQLLELVPDALSNAAVLLVDDAVARLALLRARALEERDDPSTACDAYAQAVARDSRCAEAALAQARLLRARGEWAEAAQSLRDFCDHHPEPEHRDLAEAYYKLAGLLSGPLEDMDGAIRCFERTLELAPDHPKAREPLASLLAVMPHRWTDAIVHHAELLDEKPTRTASYRSLHQIALSRENIEASRFGLAVLRAIGAASPAERAEAPDFLPRPVIAQARLEDPIAEIARRLVQHAAETIPGVLLADTGQDEGEDATSSSSADDFATRFRSAEGDVAIAGLEVLSDEALGDLLATLTALALGEESGEELLESSLDDDLLKALERGLGRWTRRKMRRLLDGTTLKQVRALDPGAWRIAVRGLAATVAVDLGHGDLRSALVYFCTHEFCTHELFTNQQEDRTIADADDLTARIAGSAIAEELLRRVAASWCQELVRS